MSLTPPPRSAALPRITNVNTLPNKARPSSAGAFSPAARDVSPASPKFTPTSPSSIGFGQDVPADSKTSAATANKREISPNRRRGKGPSKKQLKEMERKRLEAEREEFIAREKAAEELQTRENLRRDIEQKRDAEKAARLAYLEKSVVQKDETIATLRQQLLREREQTLSQIKQLTSDNRSMWQNSQELKRRLDDVEKEAEDRLLTIQALKDELVSVKAQVSMIQKEAETHNEHMSELSSNLHHQLSLLQMENRVLRIEVRNKETDLGNRIREMQYELKKKLDALIDNRQQQLMEIHGINSLKQFISMFDEKEDEYMKLLHHGREKVKHLHDFFYQIQPLHTNLPIHVKVQLEALNKTQLFLLLDVLCCYEPVINFLNHKFPP